MIIHWRLPSYIFSRPGRTLLFGAILVSIIILLTFSRSDHSSAALEREISHLSVYYVRALARERGINNLPSSADLHKTMPVLLRSLVLRLNHMEKSARLNSTRKRQGRYASVQDSNSAANKVKKPTQLEEMAIKEELERFNMFCSISIVHDALKKSPKQCRLPVDSSTTHPECLGKQDWMSKFHGSHRCYGDYGVDSNPCSAIFYLSEIESFCPRSLDFKPALTDIKPVFTDLNLILTHAPPSIQERVERQWPEWSKAASKMPQILQQRMALFIGKRGALSYTETLMWADLTGALHALGHNIVWIHSKERLQSLLNKFPSVKPDVPCPSHPSIFLNVLYTDEEGRQMIEAIMGQSFSKMACILRIMSPQGEIPNRELPPTGLVWRQYLTAYPLMEDHVFLGFALAPLKTTGERKMAAVIGSSVQDFAKAGPYLQAISKRFPIHTAIADNEVAEKVARLLSPHVTITNTFGTLNSLLDSAAVLVGLGRPFNDPFIVEAMARGINFINPRLTVPVRLSNFSDQWFQETQHSYFERFGFNSLLVDPIKTDVVERELWKVKPGTGVLPFEFSHSGYLQRLSKFLQHHDFCSPPNNWDVKWPPSKSVEFFLGIQSDSCEVTCLKRDRRCEPSYFPSINMRQELEERGIACSRIYFRANPLYPAVDANNLACHFQSESLRYSCFHRPVSSTLQRICPCRDVMKNQNALCVNC